MNDRLMLDVARRLLEATHEQYLEAAADQLRRLLPSDEVVWMQTSWNAQSFTFWRQSTATRDPAGEEMLSTMYEHPAIQSYLRLPSDLVPRRLSDVGEVRGDSSASAMRLSQELIGPRQVSLIVSLQPPHAGDGWVIGRAGRDFDDETMTRAVAVLPLLLVFDRLHGRARLDGSAAPAEGWRGLTARERQVADLLGAGLTARAIGRTLGISHRTVSKHLENVYRKLGHHDRLLVALENRDRVDRSTRDVRSVSARCEGATRLTSGRR